MVSKLRGSHRLGAGLLALVFLLGCGYLVYPLLRARYLFHELGALQVGHSSFEDAQRLAKRLSGKPSSLSPCNRSYCYWSAELER
jgi:hypothetical protein